MAQYDPITGMPTAGGGGTAPSWDKMILRWNKQGQQVDQYGNVLPSGPPGPLVNYAGSALPTPDVLNPTLNFTAPSFAGLGLSSPLTSPYASYGNYVPPTYPGQTGLAAGSGQSIQLAPAFTPDFASLIANDPNLQQFNKDLAAQDVADKAALTAAQNRAIATFGEVPAGLNVDAQTAALAQQNTNAGLSTVAQLRRQNEEAQRQITNELAARGILRSGETGFQLGRANDAYNQAQYNARDTLTSYLNGVAQAYAESQQRRSQQQVQAAQQAQSYEATLPQNQPRAERRAYLDPNGSGLYYEAETGLWYQPDGTPAPPPAGANPAIPQPYPVAPSPLPPAPVTPGLTPPTQPNPAPLPDSGYRINPATFVGGPTIGRPATPRLTLNRRYAGSRPG